MVQYRSSVLALVAVRIIARRRENSDLNHQTGVHKTRQVVLKLKKGHIETKPTRKQKREIIKNNSSRMFMFYYIFSIENLHDSQLYVVGELLQICAHLELKSPFASFR